MQLMPASRAACLLVTTMMVAAPAFAQTPSPTSPPAAQPSQAPTAGTASPTPTAPSGTAQKAMPMGRHAAMARHPGESMESLVERRITNLHARLHITPDQSQPWDAFAQAMRDNAKDLDQRYEQRSQSLGTMSAVDAMKSFADIEQTRAEDMQKLVPAFQTLYGSLSDQQKKAADELFRNYAENEQRGPHQASAR
jgi:protein CpxP